MGIRSLIILGSAILAAFAAGHAYSQNDVKTADVTTADGAKEFPFAVDNPFAPELPADKSSDEPKKKVMPLKYFIPKAEGGAEQGTEELGEMREKFADLAAKKAAIMSLEELRLEIESAENVLREFAAGEALDRVEEALEHVVATYPDTDAGIRAKRALSELRNQASPLRPVETRTE